MIIARSPLRISLGGGGTDLESYYSKNIGFVISAAINKYVYVTITQPFRPGIYLKYSSIEKTDKIEKVKHPIIREVLKEEKLFKKSLELTTLADIPSGTGLGSSGSFTTALIKAIYFDQRKIISGKKLAEKACKIEIDKLKEPSGKQDQYISSFGGVNCFTFNKNGNVNVKPLKISEKNLSKLENNLLLFYTGFTRRSKKILITQKNNSESKKSKGLANGVEGGQNVIHIFVGDTPHVGQHEAEKVGQTVKRLEAHERATRALHLCLDRGRHLVQAVALLLRRCRDVERAH